MSKEAASNVVNHLTIVFFISIFSSTYHPPKAIDTPLVLATAQEEPTTMVTYLSLQVSVVS